MWSQTEHFTLHCSRLLACIHTLPPTGSFRTLRWVYTQPPIMDASAHAHMQSYHKHTFMLHTQEPLSLTHIRTLLTCSLSLTQSWCTHAQSLSLSLTHTHTLSHSHSLSLSLTHTHDAHTLSLSLSHTHSQTHTLSLTQSWCTHAQSLSHTHSHTHSLTQPWCTHAQSLSLSHTHTHTHTHKHTLSHSHDAHMQSLPL